MSDIKTPSFYPAFSTHKIHTLFRSQLYCVAYIFLRSKFHLPAFISYDTVRYFPFLRPLASPNPRTASNRIGAVPPLEIQVDSRLEIQESEVQTNDKEVLISSIDSHSMQILKKYK